jgi:hypothetical protein
MPVSHGAATVACYYFENVRAEVGDEEVTVSGESKAVGERAVYRTAVETTTSPRADLEAAAGHWSNEPLCSIGPDVHNTTAAVGRPQ